MIIIVRLRFHGLLRSQRARISLLLQHNVDSLPQEIRDRKQSWLVDHLAEFFGGLTPVIQPEYHASVVGEWLINVHPYGTDILANAGGVTASYFEWAQSRQGFAWEGDLVAERLRRVMSTAFDAVWRRSRDLKVTPRRGAVAVALERVGEAIEVRGLFP